MKYNHEMTEEGVRRAAAAQIVKLRKAAGESQQAFASRIGMSISAVARSETGTLLLGDPEIFLRLLREARRLGLPASERALCQALLGALNTDRHELAELLN